MAVPQGVYVLNPNTPPGLPFGDKAVLVQVDGKADGLVLFIDGEMAVHRWRNGLHALAATARNTGYADADPPTASDHCSGRRDGDDHPSYRVSAGVARGAGARFGQSRRAAGSAKGDPSEGPKKLSQTLPRNEVDGLRKAAEEILNFAGREIPMGLTPASDGRWAFAIREPIGVVAAISAFNHPLNLIVHQASPAIAVGCPVIVKPAAPTPLCCLALVALPGRRPPGAGGLSHMSKEIIPEFFVPRR
jgi:hypothetical protein